VFANALCGKDFFLGDMHPCQPSLGEKVFSYVLDEKKVLGKKEPEVLVLVCKMWREGLLSQWRNPAEGLCTSNVGMPQGRNVFNEMQAGVGLKAGALGCVVGKKCPVHRTWGLEKKHSQKLDVCGCFYFFIARIDLSLISLHMGEN